MDRPYTLDYINALFEDFTELHGDRNFSDDPAIVGGIKISGLVNRRLLAASSAFPESRLVRVGPAEH